MRRFSDAFVVSGSVRDPSPCRTKNTSRCVARFREILPTWMALTLVPIASSSAAETGDFDGDGRLTIADCTYLQDGRDAAVGSLDGFLSNPCHESYRAEAENDFRRHWLQSTTYFEILRRSFDDSLPHWTPLWPDELRSEWLDPSDDVVVEWDPARPVERDGDGTLVLRLRIVAKEAIRAFSIVIESESSVLRHAATRFRYPSWWMLSHDSGRSVQDDGDIGVWNYPPAELITNGRYVLCFGLDRPTNSQRRLNPGSYEIIARGRLAVGTPAGSYRLSVSGASQVVLARNSVPVAPALSLDSADALLRVARPVAGPIHALPPLSIDLAERRIDGALEFRILDAEASPGESVDVRVQMRSEIPLNHIQFDVRWPRRFLHCNSVDHPESVASGATILLARDESGGVYPANPGSLGCFDTGPWTGGVHRFRLGLPGSRIGGGSNPSTDLLDTFRFPTGQWVDLADIHLRIADDAPGGAVVPLQFEVARTDTFVDASPSGPWGNCFFPYAPFPCVGFDRSSTTDEYWKHESPILHHGEVRVLGNQDPPLPSPPPDLGFRVQLGDAHGSPGDTVEVPVFASITDGPVGRIHLAFEVDSEAAEIEGFAYDMFRSLTSETIRKELGRGESESWNECEVPGEARTCGFFGIPWSVNVLETESRHLVVFVSPAPDVTQHATDYLTGTLRRIGWVLVRVRVEFGGSSIRVEPAEVPSPFFGDPPLRCDAFPPDLAFAAPAREVSGATITTGSGVFRRGDANADGNLDLSDAVGTLGFLFLGASAPACEGAADTDDSGVIDVTDPIALLGHLFLGGREPAVPFPGCGDDPTEDGLTCARGACSDEL